MAEVANLTVTSDTMVEICISSGQSVYLNIVFEYPSYGSTILRDIQTKMFIPWLNLNNFMRYYALQPDKASYQNF